MSKTYFKSKNNILSNASAIYNNVFILYFILILSLSNLFYLVTSANYMFASIFILVGFITSFFSKNMIVILFIALTVTNLLQFGKKTSLSEGFDSNKDDATAAAAAAATGSDATAATGSNATAAATGSDAAASATGSKTDILNKIKTTLNTITSKVDNATTSDKSDKDKENMDTLVEGYQQLLSLQNEISKNMDNINIPLTKAENILDKMAKQLNITI